MFICRSLWFPSFMGLETYQWMSILHVWIYVWEPCLCLRTGLDPTVSPSRDPDSPARQEGESLCYFFPLPDNHISLHYDLHQLPTLQTSVQLPVRLSASHSSVPQNPQTPHSPDLPPPSQGAKSSRYFTTVFSTFTDCSQCFSSNMHPWPQMAATSQPPWPQPPVQTLNHACPCQAWPQTQTVNFCIAQNHQTTHVSINFRVQSHFVKVSFLLLKIFRSAHHWQYNNAACCHFSFTCTMLSHFSYWQKNCPAYFINNWSHSF